MKEKMFVCNVCGNVMLQVAGPIVTPECCGEPMSVLNADTSEGSIDYHVPVIEKKPDGSYQISVGKSPHPMTEHHSIQFIYVATCHGGIIRFLHPGDTPSVTIRTDECPEAVYAYCNIHGLYVTKCKECK